MSYTDRQIADTIRALRKLDPEMRKQLPKQLKAAAGPLVVAGRAAVPERAPLRGWTSGRRGGRLGWDTAKIRRSISIRFRGSGRPGGEFTLLKLQSTSPALSVYEFANKARSRGRYRVRNNPASSTAFISGVRRAGGAPARVLWPAVEKQLPYVTDQVEEILDEISKTVNRRTARRSRR